MYHKLYFPSKIQPSLKDIEIKKGNFWRIGMTRICGIITSVSRFSPKNTKNILIVDNGHCKF